MINSAAVVTAIFSLLFQTCFSQIEVDAGPDQYVCLWSGNEQASLTSSATGGTPPYTYAWETSYTFTAGQFSMTFNASDMLNDTTLANPQFTTFEGDTLEFLLTVTDAEGATGTDVVTVYFSRFYSHLGYVNYTVNLGDSIFLSGWENVSGGIPPYQYLWRPNHGLTDSTSLSFWAKPETSVAYYMTVTDSVGCVVTGAPVYFIQVLPLSVDNVKNDNTKVQVFPNPAETIVNLQIDPTSPGPFALRIYTAEGRPIDRREFNGHDYKLNVSTYPSGVYIYEVENQDGVRSQGRLVVQ